MRLYALFVSLNIGDGTFYRGHLLQYRREAIQEPYHHG
jgi:hypothetical protein